MLPYLLPFWLSSASTHLAPILFLTCSYPPLGYQEKDSICPIPKRSQRAITFYRRWDAGEDNPE